MRFRQIFDTSTSPLGRAPKHQLPGLGSKEDVLGHPVAGQTWEGFIIENIINAAPGSTTSCFYRASGGAEIDLILALPGRRPWAIEIKRSLEPRLTRGFHDACADVDPEAKYVVYSGKEQFAMPNDVSAISVVDLARRVANVTAA